MKPLLLAASALALTACGSRGDLRLEEGKTLARDVVFGR